MSIIAHGCFTLRAHRRDIGTDRDCGPHSLTKIDGDVAVHQKSSRSPSTSSYIHTHTSTPSGYHLNMSGDSDQGGDWQQLRHVLNDLGFANSVEEELQALTASAEGAAFCALVIITGTGVAKGWYEFCKIASESCARK